MAEADLEAPHLRAEGDDEADALLERLINEDPASKEESGLFDEAEEDEGDPDGSAEQEVDLEESEEPVEQPAEEDDGYAEAFLLLKGAGLAPADILQLSRADAVQMGRRLQAEAASSPEGESAQAAVQPQAPAFDTDALRSALSDELGDEAGPAVVTALEKLSQAMQAQVEERLSGLNETVSSLRQMTLQREINTARAELKTRFPDLANDGKYARVRERMDVLARTGSYDDVVTCMQDACMLELPATEPTPRATSRAKKKSGQPSRPGRKAVDPPSRAAKEDEILRRLMSTEPGSKGTPEQLRREFFGS